MLYFIIVAEMNWPLVYWGWLLAALSCVHGYKVGVGIADITGPPAEVAFVSVATLNIPMIREYIMHISSHTLCFFWGNYLLYK